MTIMDVLRFDSTSKETQNIKCQILVYNNVKQLMTTIIIIVAVYNFWKKAISKNTMAANV